MASAGDGGLVVVWLRSGLFSLRRTLPDELHLVSVLTGVTHGWVMRSYRTAMELFPRIQKNIFNFFYVLCAILFFQHFLVYFFLSFMPICFTLRAW